MHAVDPLISSTTTYSLSSSFSSSSSSSSKPTLSSVTFAKLLPKSYHREFVVGSSLRADGRPSLLDHRASSIVASPIHPSHANSSTLISTKGSENQSAIITAVRLEVATPTTSATPDDSSSSSSSSPSSSSCGRVNVEFHLSGLVSTKFAPQNARQANDKIMHMQQTLNTRINSYVDLPSLCIVPGRSSWLINIDFFVLSFDGIKKILDQAHIAAIKTLKQLRLPDTEIDEDGEVFVTPGIGQPIKFKSDAIISASFACIDNVLIADPTSAEEDICSSSFTLFFSLPLNDDESDDVNFIGTNATGLVDMQTIKTARSAIQTKQYINDTRKLLKS